MNAFNNFKWGIYKYNPAKTSWAVIGILFLITSIYICLKEPVLGNDSYGYMGMDVIRPAGYPLFLYLVRQIFGEYYLQATVIIQTFMNAIVFIVFFRYINKTFKIDVGYLLLLLPIAIYFFIQEVSPEIILTEALAFPLYILIAILMIESIVKRDLRILIISILITAILVTIRGQFLFMYPLFLLVGGYIFFRKGELRSLKMASAFIAVIIFSLIGSSLINRTYHYVFHGEFASPHINGSIIVNTFYLSEKDDYRFLEEEINQQIYIEIFDTLYSEGLNMSAFYDKINPTKEESLRRKSDVIYHYYENYNSIYSLIKSKFDKTDPRDIQSVIDRDNRLKAITYNLLPRYFFSYLYINLSDIFVHGLNNSRLNLLLLLLFTLITFIGLLRQNLYAELLFFFTCAYVLNLILMAIANRVIERYTFYVTFIVCAIVLLFLVRGLLMDRFSPSLSIASTVKDVEK